MSKKQRYLNVVGYECNSAWTAQFSTRKIIRHVTGACGCDPEKGTRCHAVKRYAGFDYGNLGIATSEEDAPQALKEAGLVI